MRTGSTELPLTSEILFDVTLSRKILHSSSPKPQWLGLFETSGKKYTVATIFILPFLISFLTPSTGVNVAMLNGYICCNQTGYRWSHRVERGLCSRTLATGAACEKQEFSFPSLQYQLDDDNDFRQ